MLKTVTGTINATTIIIPAVSGKKLKIQSYAIFTPSTSLIIATFKSGVITSDRSLWTIPLKAITGTIFGANLSSRFPGFLFSTEINEFLELSINTFSANLTYSVTYWDTDNF